MKANEAPDFPEKVYIPRDPEYPQFPDIWWERESDGSNIEYTRTDAFIDKACEWLKKNSHNYADNALGKEYLVSDFVNYMKGE